ncbi:MAG TPA: carboxypeptidase regulatory-like domain-containing protein [Vicinamibacterales bacterium]|nr:carboxypeptidase regulatory-like domain-containing protein [Vicinamibacterales bacterium]
MRGRALAVACVAGAGVLVAAAQPPATGAIRGRVEIARDVGPIERRPRIADLGGAPGRPAVDRRRSVVYLEAAPRRAFDDDRVETRATMDQRNETFIPHVLAIMAGTVVDFPNNDRTYHNVFSLSRAKSFDLGRYPTGHSKAVRFDRPGIVRVFCDIHSHMSAFILVFGHPYFAVTDDQGRYRIADVPAGTYTVAVWNEAVPGESRRVVVPEGGDVEVNFTLGRERD